MRLGLTVFVLGLRGLEVLDPFGRTDRGDASRKTNSMRRSAR
jgi:hypothetical protein